MSAPAVHRALRAELDPWFREQGFRRVRSSPLEYRLAHGDAFLTVWFQLDRWGWNALWGGSRFFVNFRLGDAPDRDAPCRREERLNFFLTDEELEAARALHDAVVARVPPPPPELWRRFEEQSARYPDGAGMVAALRANFEPTSRPFLRHQDFGLRYFDEGDVQAWARLIAGVLPRALDAMRAWWPAHA